MKTNNEDLKDLTVGELFSSEDQYLIPIYQRNYEWEDKQIIQLIEDICDYYIEEEEKQYYIGTLVVDFRDDKTGRFYETIDGQQRLTTLNLLICALKAIQKEGIISDKYEGFLSKTNIHFESRPISEKTIDFVFRNGNENPKFTDFNENIVSGTNIILTHLKQLENQFSSTTKETSWLCKTFEGFLDYLFQKVIIVRVQVPLDTDLNHYFEIMNSRGEQLEKHEILKSRLMKELNVCTNSLELRKQFNLIWEACSQMESYSQMIFPKEIRFKLFGERWFNFKPKNQTEMFSILETNEVNSNSSNEGLSFDQIVEVKDQNNLQDKIKELQNEDIINESDGKQFQPIINFENFLLHVLKLVSPLTETKLDDKRLLLFFKHAIENCESKELFVKNFAYQLLKSKFLLDQYIIKRKYAGGEDFWSLEMLKFYPKIEQQREQESFNYVNTFHNSNSNLVMLLSMFHVSTPTLVYKNWLFEVLKYLDREFEFISDDDAENPKNVQTENYNLFLENLAKKFLKYRFINKEKELSYEEMMNDDLSNYKTSFNLDSLYYGNIRNNLVFNYIDYLLWKNSPNKYSGFEFSFRSSIEHFYPQNPISGERIEDEKILNCIGNLCLISHSNNSRMSNFLPQAKREHYISSSSKDSIKQIIMMEEMVNNSENRWFIDEITAHNEKIIQLLKSDLNT